jgi:hypothetical protein
MPDDQIVPETEPEQQAGGELDDDELEDLFESDDFDYDYDDEDPDYDDEVEPGDGPDA